MEHWWSYTDWGKPKYWEQKPTSVSHCPPKTLNSLARVEPMPQRQATTTLNNDIALTQQKTDQWMGIMKRMHDARVMKDL
jgi:hypothetical protein